MISGRVSLKFAPRTGSLAKVSSVGQPPSMGTDQSWATPVTLLRKATCLPSGENVGEPALRTLRNRSMPKEEDGMVASCMWGVGFGLATGPRPVSITPTAGGCKREWDRRRIATDKP